MLVSLVLVHTPVCRWVSKLVLSVKCSVNSSYIYEGIEHMDALKHSVVNSSIKWISRQLLRTFMQSVEQ